MTRSEDPNYPGAFSPFPLHHNSLTTTNVKEVYYYLVMYSSYLVESDWVMIMNAQFKKGVLELCVLVLTANRDRYGYELVASISEKFHISEGSVYPLLRRLTQEGMFTTYLAESQEGPPRKYYQLTERGRMYMNDLILEWHVFSRGVNRIIEEGLGYDEA